jgi:hypothetical protein
MSAEQRIIKARELSAITKELFITGLNKRFPDSRNQKNLFTTIS